MRKLILALEKGMWAGWIFIVPCLIAFIIIGRLKIDQEDLSVKRGYICAYQEGLIVNGIDTGVPETPFWPLCWLSFCGAVMFLRHMTDPITNKFEFVSFSSKGSYHDFESLFKIGVLLFCWFCLMTVIGVLLASYYPRVPLVINGEVYTYKSGFDFWNEAPSWINNLASVVCFFLLLSIGYLFMKGKNDRLDSK